MFQWIERKKAGVEPCNDVLTGNPNPRHETVRVMDSRIGTGWSLLVIITSLSVC
jgi:hypothetical protein